MSDLKERNVLGIRGSFATGISGVIRIGQVTGATSSLGLAISMPLGTRDIFGSRKVTDRDHSTAKSGDQKATDDSSNAEKVSLSTEIAGKVSDSVEIAGTANVLMEIGWKASVAMAIAGSMRSQGKCGNPESGLSGAATTTAHRQLRAGISDARIRGHALMGTTCDNRISAGSSSVPHQCRHRPSEVIRNGPSSNVTIDHSHTSNDSLQIRHARRCCRSGHCLVRLCSGGNPGATRSSTYTRCVRAASSSAAATTAISSSNSPAAHTSVA